MISIDFLEGLGLKIYKQYGDEVVAWCPLHDDKHPSLGINIKTGKYLCRAGCIKGHSIESLVYDLTGEKINLARAENLYFELKRKLSPKIQYKKLPSIPVLPLAIDNDGEDFLKKRKLNRDTILSWNIMYWESINAVVIPCEDVGFIIRYIDAVSPRDKYKYVSGTKITNCLFGLKKLENNNFIILVEGAFDVMWLHQIGIKNCLGLLHGGISEVQKKILKGLTSTVCLMLDSDEGGENIKKDVINKLKSEFIIKISNLPKGKDPNDCNEYEIKESLLNKILAI